jgi:hypothetical protein
MAWPAFAAAAQALAGFTDATALRRATEFLDVLGVVVYKGGGARGGATPLGHGMGDCEPLMAQGLDDVVVLVPQVRTVTRAVHGASGKGWVGVGHVDSWAWGWDWWRPLHSPLEAGLVCPACRHRLPPPPRRPCPPP